jgi:hypothetical protein
LFMLVNLTNEEYKELAERYKAEKKPDQLKQAFAKMDEAIDWMARAIAAAEGQPQFQPIAEELRKDLTQYYTFRHEGKTAGMNELIQKYKKPN